MAKVRVDVLLVELGLAESRAQAQRLVMAGQVRANGQVVLKPSNTLPADVHLEVEQGPPFVSRGGEKLAAALANFPIVVKNKICADVGASTGGFTDCLLQNGAGRVYAIDVGKGILHWKLRQDPRVVVMEETNARFIERLPEPIELVTIDASFISLKILLPVVKGWLPQAFALDAAPPTAGATPASQVIALIKPQFEAGRSEVSRGDGVIRDPLVHKAILEELLTFAQNEGFGVQGLLRSPLLGPKGNVEFLAWLSWPGQVNPVIEALAAQVT
jgi:23S rRNA (cytidine1920-2'-O)/16S rRNA (cytidine1409-2'-O)-methyltransferase